MKNYKTIIQKLKKNYCGNNNLYMKREDLFPEMLGGNKARKAQYFIKEAIEKKADCLITYGSKKSNHCRVIAGIAAQNDMKCILIVANDEFEKVNLNQKAINLFGAEVIYSEVAEVSKTIENIKKRERNAGFNPYFIQGGGHGNLGTQAYVDAFKEILIQEKEININFDYIFLASGTGTTQAGLLCGNYLKKMKKEIIGISIARSEERGKSIIKSSVEEYLNKDESVKIKFLDEYICGGYGKYNDEIIELTRMIFIKEGIPMNLTYTGKAFYGMTEYLKKEKIEMKNILFINTGGAPLFFDDIKKI